MNRKNLTRNALFTSVLSLLLCVSMLVGTTFAWFTDSVTSAGNKVVAGNLDVELYQWIDGERKEITDQKEAVLDGGILWEPGMTQVVYLSIKNAGSLALKYKVNVNVKDTDDAQNLYEAMRYEIIPDAQYDTVTAWDGTNAKSVVPGVNETQANDVRMDNQGDEHFFALAVHMQEDAGNKYQSGSVEFDLAVLAGQLTSELDSFDNTYDALAAYPGTGFAALPAAGQSAVEVDVKNNEDQKIGSVVVPAAAIAEDATGIKVDVKDSSYEGNFTIAADLETKVVDVKVEGLKEGNTTPVKVTLYAPPGLDPDTVRLFHYDEEIDCTYDPYTGYVKFESTDFSPFTIVYDAESKYEAPEINDQIQLPTAIVTSYTDTENIEWGNYGQWSPNPDLEAKLDVAYKFSCPDELDPKFAHWYCDFYVKLDQDLGANEIFLGGNYGDFGWIGFHNGDMTLEANTEIGLLESVTTNPWTYEDVYNYVGEFICGVGNVGDSLQEATFTVMLRLTNPENPEQFYNVATITHQFPKVVYSGDELQDAVNNGSENIQLGGDIDLNNGGIVIP